jgi:hypothetical protein
MVAFPSWSNRGGAREGGMPITVNLDAMIKREDLDVTDKSKVQISLGASLKLYELELT